MPQYIGTTRRTSRHGNTRVKPNSGTGAPTPGGGGSNVVWRPTPKAAGTVIGDFADPDFTHVVTDEAYTTVCPTVWKNGYWDANGDIVMRIMREPAGLAHPRLGGTCYSSGSFLCTFNYGSGWPMQTTNSSFFNGQQPPYKQAWGLGHRWEADMLYPAKDGAYCCSWLMPVNKRNTAPDGVIEVDWAENRPNSTPEGGSYSNLRLVHYNAAHYWDAAAAGGKRFADFGAYKTGVTDITANWHHYAVEVDASGVRVYFDGVQTLSALPPRNSDGTVQSDVQLGIMFNACIGYPANSFVNGYENPLPADCTAPGAAAAEWYWRIRNLTVSTI